MSLEQFIVYEKGSTGGKKHSQNNGVYHNKEIQGRIESFQWPRLEKFKQQNDIVLDFNPTGL